MTQAIDPVKSQRWKLSCSVAQSFVTWIDQNNAGAHFFN